MALSSLLDGQTIQIDNHHRNVECKWGKAIHLHKRMNAEKYRGVEVIIPIAEDGELEFRGVGRKEKIDIHIENEIRKAFSNSTIRTRFVTTLLKSLSNLFSNSNISKDEWYRLFEEVAGRIVGYFGIKDKVGERINSDIIKYCKAKGINIYIKADKDSESVILGTDMSLVDNFNKEFGNGKY